MNYDEIYEWINKIPVFVFAKHEYSKKYNRIQVQGKDFNKRMIFYEQLKDREMIPQIKVVSVSTGEDKIFTDPKRTGVGYRYYCGEMHIDILI